ncbi:hypothetical protein F5Y17DRAFT_430868 [Xylariaceae sp. FL0594]|nr:hypothetical protein F5Y17DRAFT_430868 [Xylariaceae sp. FL0594]
MKSQTLIALRLARSQCRRASIAPSPYNNLPAARHLIHSTTASPATVSPIHGTGPPPEPPRPAADSAGARLERRKRHAEMLERAQEIRSGTSSAAKNNAGGSSSQQEKSTTATSPLARRRFWKHVHVREVDGHLEVHLDARPLRRPSNKEIVRIPSSKPLLAAALAHEWDMIVSAQQATQPHLIPLTSLVNRALDIADDDAGRAVYSVNPNETDPAAKNQQNNSSSSKAGGLRTGIVRMLMRYLDTDSLLCWAPPPRRGQDAPDAQGRSLRELQMRATDEIVSFLTAHVWPGLQIAPVLDGESIVPKRQKPETRQVIEGWVMGLDAWELAGLEKAVLAGKGLLGAVRLLVEWSEGFAGAGRRNAEGVEGKRKEKEYGVEEATNVARIEVAWQIGNWGEVEDTHDVEREDIRRQFGSVVLLVSGTGRQ